MQNNAAVGFLLDYSAQKLDPAKSALVESHLEMCESCRELVNAQRAVYDSLQAWDAIEVSSDFNRRLYARIEAENQRSGVLQWAGMLAARWYPFSWRPVATVAASCALLVAALCIQGPANYHHTEQESRAKVERVDVEQVERTLQDLDMLKQLNPTVAAEANSSSSI